MSGMHKALGGGGAAPPKSTGQSRSQKAVPYAGQPVDGWSVLLMHSVRVWMLQMKWGHGAFCYKPEEATVASTAKTP